MLIVNVVTEGVGDGVVVVVVEGARFVAREVAATLVANCDREIMVDLEAPLLEVGPEVSDDDGLLVLVLVLVKRDVV
jgi:hypothetical protein